MNRARAAANLQEIHRYESAAGTAAKAMGGA
jgi:hypothetical protein